LPAISENSFHLALGETSEVSVEYRNGFFRKHSSLFICEKTGNWLRSCQLHL